MDLLETVNRFYYDMSLRELHQMNDNLRRSTLTYNSLLYLDLIAYKEDCTVSYLADALHIAKSSVTVKINELIKLGLVQKIQSRQDKRVYYLHVTPETAEQYKNYDRAYYHAIDNMQQRYSQEEIDLFCRMLTSFSKYYGDGI